MSSKTGIIIPARTSSTRLPGKHHKLVYGDTTMIEFLVDRMKDITPSVEIILCAPREDFERFYRKDIHVYVGSNWDVLGRVIEAADHHALDQFVLVWGDSPLMCPRLIDRMLAIQKRENFDILENKGPSGFRAKIIRTEWAHAWRKWLIKANEHAFEKPPHAYWESFLESPSPHKFSVDTEADLEFIRKLLLVEKGGTLDQYVEIANTLDSGANNGPLDVEGHTPVGSSPVD